MMVTDMAMSPRKFGSQNRNVSQVTVSMTPVWNTVGLIPRSITPRSMTSENAAMKEESIFWLTSQRFP